MYPIIKAKEITMPHQKVRRGSLPIEQWIRIVFQQIDTMIIDEVYELKDWIIQQGSYTTSGYLWKDKPHAITSGQLWGGPDITAVFNSDITIPPHFMGNDVYFSMKGSSEIMVSVNGTYKAGLDPNRQWFKLVDAHESLNQYHIKLEAYTRSKPDDDRNTDVSLTHVGCVHYFEYPKLLLLNQPLIDLKYDLKVIYDLAYAEKADKDTKDYLQYHMKNILKLFPNYGSPKNVFIQHLPVIKQYIQEKIYGKTTLIGKKGKVALVAHSHLDIAYHWKLIQSIQKNARTALIQLDLMDRYPNFKFTSSQAWMYDTLEANYPSIFQKVKERIQEKKWEIVGCMYIEPDCNLISAESFVRQILYAKKYFKQMFDIDVNNAWLPDSFGVNSILPQILKLSGVDYFVTHKLSVWNDTNQFPYTHFKWRGLDGTSVNACIPPIHFVTWMDPDETIKNWDDFQSKNYSDVTLQVYGYGDGGSGVTDEMLEIYHRQEKLPGIPYQEIYSIHDFLDEAFKNEQELPVWDGDLYLEMHRGTYTSKAKLKKYNRQGEFKIKKAEILMTLSHLYQKNPSYQSHMELLWKQLLLNQFHDILPGSHTHPVGIEAVESYEDFHLRTDEFINKCYQSLLNQNEPDTYCIFNPSITPRSYYAHILPYKWHHDMNALIDNSGNTYYVQEINKANDEKIYIAEIPKIDGLSFYNFCRTSIPHKPSTLKVSPTHLENDFYSILIAENGQILSIVDKKRNRELIQKDKIANEWIMYEDKSGALNAWNIPSYYKNQSAFMPDWCNICVHEEGPLAVSIRMERYFNKSHAVQIIRLFEKKPQIDFDIWIDWHEEEKLLKAVFPLNVLSKTYTTDTSAGGYIRKSSKNTSWEQSQFEVPTHKYVDISDGALGVSIINDSKYGCDVEDSTIGISLLKAPIYPDTTSDQEEHTFTYSFYSHDGHWQQSDLMHLSYDLNDPLILNKGKAIDSTSLFKINNKQLELLAIKLAEDCSDDIIIRLCEIHGSGGMVKIDFNIAIEEVFIIDLLENIKQKLPCTHNSMEYTFHSHEIMSFRIKRK